MTLQEIEEQLELETKSLSSVKGVPKLGKLEFDFEIVKGEESCEKVAIQVDRNESYSKENPFKATLLSHKILCGEKNGVYELTLDITGMGWKYVAGDSFGILCRNQSKSVDSIISYLGLNRDSIVRFGKTKRPSYLNRGDDYSILELFTSWIDLYTTPKKQFFRWLAEETDSETERGQLLYISSLSGKAIYTKLRDHYCTVLDILRLFPSCKPSFALMLEYLSPLQPRYYSVSQSSSSVSNNRLCFVFNVFRFGTTDDSGVPLRGLCSGTLEDYTVSLHQRHSLFIFPRIPPIPFNLKDRTNDQVLLIANGTGVGPFLAFLQDLHEKQKKATLLYGHRDHFDGIYKMELDEFVREGTLTLIECLSRVEDHPHKYVQDAISSSAISSQFLYSSTIYLCGSSAMGKGVFDALVQRKVDSSSSLQEAVAYWSGRANEGSFLREIWG